MSLLKKLELRGIRCYGPNHGDTQVVNFNSPVTLILGDNGCGKTTIIEALKFATSGGLPSGSRQGHNFIYYPKLEQLIDVLGSIKLKFVDVAGNNITTTKIVRRQTTNTINRFTRIDSTIHRVDKNGKVNTTSGRSADVDNEICLRLGVSKPILENVIFCQQEDSNWPLDEPKRLKERFDAIFSTTSINNMADHIRKLIIKRQNKHKLNTQRLQYLREKQIELKQKHKKLKEMKIETTKIEREIKEQNNKIKNQANDIAILETKKIEINDIHISIGKLEIQIKETKRQISEVNEVIKEDFQGSIQSLINEIGNYESQILPEKNKISQLENEKETSINTLKNLVDKLSKKQIEIGSLLMKEEQFKKLQIDQDNLAKKLAAEKFGTSYSKTKEDLSEYLRDLSDEISSKAENRCIKEEKLNEKMNKSHLNVCKIEQTINLNNQKIDRLTNDLNTISKLTETLRQNTLSKDTLIETLDADFKINEKKLLNLPSKTDEDKMRNEMYHLKQTKENLMEKLMKIQRDIAIMEKIDLLQKALNDCDCEIKTFLNLHKTFLKKINWSYECQSDKPLTQALNCLEENYSHKLRTKEMELNKSRDKLTVDQTELLQKEKLMAEMEKEIITIKSNVEKICNGSIDVFESELKEAKISANKIQEKISKRRESKSFFENCIQQFHEQGMVSCPICQENFDDSNKKKSIVQHIKKNISHIPDDLKKLTNELEMITKKITELTDLKHSVSEYYNLRDKKLPEIKSSIKKMIINIKQQISSSEVIKESIKNIQDELNDIRKMLKNSNMFDSNCSKINDLHDKIDSLRKSLLEKYREMSLDELNKVQNSLQTDLKKVDTDLNISQDKMEKLAYQRIELQNKRMSLMKKKTEIEEKSRKYLDSMKKLDEINTEIENLRKKIPQLQKELEPEQNEFKKFKITLNELKTEHQTESKNDRTQFMKIEALITRMIQNYTTLEKNHDICDLVIKGKNEMKILEEEREKTSEIIDKLNEKIRIISDGTIAVQIRLRELNDILRMRQKNVELKELQKQLYEYEQRLKDLNENYVKTAIDDFKQIITKLEQIKYEKLGSLKQFERIINEIENEIQHSKYKTIKEDYFKLLVDVKTEDVVIVDLKTYLQSIEWAVMQFHTEKMIEINTRISQLWKNIYQGNDIENIMIRTDEMTVKGPTNRRSYNYKLMYIKNQVEIEMRGHSSAGQKVLASLIVRIALSDIFSDQCGILALDEPTTNLDCNNINALISALSRLINEKENDNNFQLILITHDENFVEKICHLCQVQTVNLITRDKHGVEHTLVKILEKGKNEKLLKYCSPMTINVLSGVYKITTKLLPDIWWYKDFKKNSWMPLN